MYLSCNKTNICVYEINFQVTSWKKIQEIAQTTNKTAP
jgi:hypothetical protein